MRHYDPELQYDFKEYDDFEVAHKPIEVRRHLMYVDMAMAKPSMRDFDPMALERMSDAELIELLGADIKVKKPEPVKIANPFPVQPAKPREKIKRLPRHEPVPPRYKANIWYQGKSHSLGWFMTEQVRDEVVADAKALRAMGLDPRIVQQR